MEANGKNHALATLPQQNGLHVLDTRVGGPHNRSAFCGHEKLSHLSPESNPNHPALHYTELTWPLVSVSGLDKLHREF
jgi:hypothetical protein